ncbi:T4SS efffector SepA family protein [Bradyrhizobium lupini]|uniref:T4SS efffector SepA family protein n=1 Tax=Rhizobium lupini TaxID=136996 RepID=UPI00366C21B0
MMPQINVSQSLFTQLQAIAEPFVDTPETVIAKCVEFYLSNASGHKVMPKVGEATQPSFEATYMTFQPDAPPDLTFTRPMSIELEGKSFDKGSLYWNPLLFELVRRAGQKGVKGDQLKQMLLCNYVVGEADANQGWRYIKEAGLSVQGQAANPAWKTIYHLVKSLGLTLDVVFMWEDKPKAAFPGKTAKMRFAP